MSKEASSKSKEPGISRRQFLKGIGIAGAGVVAGGIIGGLLDLGNGQYAFAVSGGYLLVDSKKCGGCETCMMACSLAHWGKSNVNLARIQIAEDQTGNFPVDLVQKQCHQCPYPACVEACPTHAMHIDKATGVRMGDKDKCIGCERCVNACPFTPSRVQWNYEDRCSQKCDLCLDTPYFDEQGGPNGKQACIEMCPMSALKFSPTLPEQNDRGYDVNLRNEHWAIVGFPIDDEGQVLPSVSVPDKVAKRIATS
jgi:Fe-S-cluster-containing dehydrogenase component